MRGHTRQQKRSHGKKGRVPRYLNENKFKHNTKSKKSEKIMALSHNGLCHRCHEKIEWKKKYRKYKAIKRSAKCYICEQMKVKRAYHTICDDCGKQQNCCVWCKLDFSKDGNKPKITREAREQIAQRESEKFENAISGLSERDKRTMRRRREREEENAMSFDAHASGAADSSAALSSTTKEMSEGVGSITDSNSSKMPSMELPKGKQASSFLDMAAQSASTAGVTEPAILAKAPVL